MMITRCVTLSCCWIERWAAIEISNLAEHLLALPFCVALTVGRVDQSQRFFMFLCCVFDVVLLRNKGDKAFLLRGQVVGQHAKSTQILQEEGV